MKREKVDNKKFYQLMLDYHKEKEINPDAPVPDEIGKMLFILVTNLSYNWHFINYTYKDVMISEGLYACIRYIDNFDPIGHENPFGYFTMVAYNAFVQIIKKEKRQSDIKNKLFDKRYFEIFESQDARKLNSMKKGHGAE